MMIAALMLALIGTPEAGAARGPVLLDFHASWCGPCKQMRPAVALLAEKGYPIQSVDIDRAANLAKRYGVTNVPTFVVVDPDGREIDRAVGALPATELASLYREARAKYQQDAQPPAPDEMPAPSVEFVSEESGASAEDREDDPSALPKPWETVVRIKVHGAGSIGFGSGTIIRSTPEESIILTCAHIFKIEGARTQPHPTRFPRKITIDLFDGELHGPRGQQVHYEASVEGEAIDYDFASDVGLIRIRPGRKLPSARVVPPSWKPLARMRMITVGCSEGNDATAWSTTIVDPKSTLRVNGNLYEAIACVHAPKQGRSGGGLFTEDGYVAGVCDFAEPQGNKGLYAAPQAIYRLLDRNRMMALYQPPRRPSDPMLARNQPSTSPSPRRAAPPATLRAQSPDGSDTRPVTIPSPELLDIPQPGLASARTNAPRTRNTAGGGRPTWQPSSGRETELAEPTPVQTEIQMAPSVVSDAFEPAGSLAEEPAATIPVPSNRERSGGGSTSSSWRAVRRAPDRTAVLPR